MDPLEAARRNQSSQVARSQREQQHAAQTGQLQLDALIVRLRSFMADEAAKGYPSITLVNLMTTRRSGLFAKKFERVRLGELAGYIYVVARVETGLVHDGYLIEPSLTRVIKVLGNRRNAVGAQQNRVGTGAELFDWTARADANGQPETTAFPHGLTAPLDMTVDRWTAWLDDMEQRGPHPR